MASITGPSTYQYEINEQQVPEPEQEYCDPYESIESSYQVEQGSVQRVPAHSVMEGKLDKGTIVYRIVIAVALVVTFALALCGFLFFLQEKSRTDDANQVIKKLQAAVSDLERQRQEVNSTISEELVSLRSEVKVMQEKLNENEAFAISQIGDVLIMEGWYSASSDLFYKKFSDNADYDTAKLGCEEIGARLISKALRMPTVIRNLLNEGIIGPTTSAYGWIGFDDIQKEDDWVWADNGHTNNNTIQWNPLATEPNGGTEENCATLHQANGMSLVYLNDLPCSESIPYLCETISNELRPTSR